MENKVSLYGANGHCKVIIDILQNADTGINIIVDDNPDAKAVLGISIVHTSQVDLSKLDNIILSIGSNKVRKKLSKRLDNSFGKAIHPTAIISNYASIEEGTVVMAGAIVNPDVRIGKHCIINTGAVIEHDCIINDFVHISPGVAMAGDVSVGEGSHIGIGASIIQGITIGQWATIGAGAVIIKNIPDFAVVVGNPGKIIKYHKENE